MTAKREAFNNCILYTAVMVVLCFGNYFFVRDGQYWACPIVLLILLGFILKFIKQYKILFPTPDA